VQQRDELSLKVLHLILLGWKEPHLGAPMRTVCRDPIQSS
jgi:hypothetical protein